MKTIKLLLVAAALAFGLSSFAGDREFADIYTECGLGAMIAPNNEAVAAVTNVTWDLGTTAISSNASSEDTCNGGGAKAAAFIYNAYPSIEQDLATGEGEHLSALLHILDCRSDAVDQLRGDFATLVSAAGYSDNSRQANAEQLYNLVTSASACHAS